MIKFRWQVDANGYQIAKNHIAEKAPIGRKRSASLTNPIDTYSGLFLSFANIGNEEQDIIDFANQHGLLMGKEWFTYDNDNLAYTADQLVDWKNGIANMNRMVKLWQAIESEDREYLKKYIQWRKVGEDLLDVKVARNGVVYVDQSELTWIETNASRGSLIQPARDYLYYTINHKLLGHTSIRLLKDGESSTIATVPDTLLSALWLQFAQAISGNRKYETCIVCGTEFEIKRKGKKTCSTKCRTRKSRGN